MTISRRAFVVGAGAAGGALALGLARIARAAGGTARELAPNAFIVIPAELAPIKIVCHRSEMGQGVRSTLPALLADELGADPSQIAIVQGDGDDRYGDQDTDGSSSIRMRFDEFRMLAATAREMLVAAAAKRWRVPASRLVVASGEVRDPQARRTLLFQDLAAEAAQLPIPKAPKLRPLGELSNIGKDGLRAVDAPDQVIGRAVYGADVRVPGMLTAVIARPPALYGSVAKLDAARAKHVPGVRDVVTLPSPKPPVAMQALGGVAVIADNTWAAMKGRAALAIEWDAGPNGTYDSAAYTEQLLAAVRAPGEVVRTIGDADAALANAATRVDAEYLVPHLAHAAMEPPAAVARVDGDRCEVWACTQGPDNVQDGVAKALGIAKKNVTVHVTLLGGGFGRKSFPDFAIEAALCARAAKAPVRVQWTRDDDLQHSTYHTACAQQLSAGLDDHGDVTAWRHRLAFPSIHATFAAGADHPSNGELGQGILDLPLAVPNVRVETGAAPSHARVGWLRSVCNINHAFAVQSFIAELAHATKRDPRDMLLRVLGPARVLTAATQGVKDLPNYEMPFDKHAIDVARLHRVIDKVTAMADWDKSRAAGRALGLAAHRSFVTYVAVVASVVTGPRGELRVDEAWIACDCGLAVNPERVRYQMEGAFMFAMSNAMHGAITMKRGAVEQTGFRDYRLARMPEAPRAIHVELIAGTGPPGGVGEPGVPPVAPAIANAAFALDGKRRRIIPFIG